MCRSTHDFVVVCEFLEWILLVTATKCTVRCDDRQWLYSRRKWGLPVFRKSSQGKLGDPVASSSSHTITPLAVSSSSSNNNSGSNNRLPAPFRKSQSDKKFKVQQQQQPDIFKLGNSSHHNSEMEKKYSRFCEDVENCVLERCQSRMPLAQEMGNDVNR